MEKLKEFTHTIKRARAFMEKEYEKLLRAGNCTGAIFALKNFGWTDKQEIEHSGGVDITSRMAAMSKEELEAFVKDCREDKY